MQTEKKTKKNLVILSIIIILLLLIVVLLVALLFVKPQQQAQEVSSLEGNKLVYEQNVVVDNEDDLQKAVDALIEKAKEGQMALEMQTEAYSADGQHFSCYLANAVNNNYDMFMVIYLDETQEEIYRTGLIPIGARIEEFELEAALESGVHEVTIVYNQVEEDNETIHAQVNVGLLLVVD